ncbi:MAG: hypothetical protein R3C60_06315 [Parvularculaceae bacterium]
MSLTLIAPPIEEPVSLAELKDHMRINGAAEDAAIAGFGVAARQMIEARFGIAIIAQGWRLSLDAPPRCALTLPLSPVASVDSVGVKKNGVTELVSAGGYETQTGPVGRLLINTPLVTDQKLGVVVIAFTAGWPDAASVPDELKLAVKTLAAHFYEHREGEGAPPAIASLLARYRQVRL